MYRLEQKGGVVTYRQTDKKVGLLITDRQGGGVTTYRQTRRWALLDQEGKFISSEAGSKGSGLQAINIKGGGKLWLHFLNTLPTSTHEREESFAIPFPLSLTLGIWGRLCHSFMGLRL